MAYEATVRRVTSERGGARVEWVVTDGDTGAVYGPFVAQRPAGDDHAAWAAARAAVFDVAPPSVAAPLNEQLVAFLGAYSDEELLAAGVTAEQIAVIRGGA